MASATRPDHRTVLGAFGCALVLALVGACAASPRAATAPLQRPTATAGAAVPFGTAPIAVAPRTTPAARLTPPRLLPLGSYSVNPVTQQREPVIGDLARAAVLIGDSQSEPTDSWVRRGLEQAGYSVYFAGSGGTGYSVGIPKVHDYVDALRLGDWLVPAGAPALVVVQGGGNDASRNAADRQIVSGATSLVAELRRTYPHSRIVMVGTLAKSAADGGGRRTQVDALLRGTAENLGVTFIGCGDWISRYGLAGDLADGVHLRASGHTRLAPVLASALAAEGLTLP